MKNFVFKPLFIAFILLSCQVMKSQESSLKVYPHFGLAFGFFNPSDVNDYIEGSLGEYLTEYGTENIFMYYEVQGGITFRLKKIDFSGFLEYAFAPKWIVVTNGENTTFNFSRVSPGINANVYLPMGSGKHAFLIGAGVQYHIMQFEEFSASDPGFRMQAGVSLQFGKFNLQPYLGFKYANATDDTEEMWEDFNMNYTGGQIGIIMSFHPPVNYK
jgi:hypothetical protein